jgi:hypothetical protein
MLAVLALLCLSPQEFVLEQYVVKYDKKAGSSREEPLPAGDQLTEQSVFMRVRVKFDLPFIAEFELKHKSLPFDGKNLLRSAGGRYPRSADTGFTLKRPGGYHWRVRITADKEVTQWKDFSTDPAFVIPGAVAPIVFRPAREATKEEVTKAVPVIEARLKALKIAGFAVRVLAPDQDGIARLELAPNDPEFDLEPIRRDVEELVSHQGILSWAVSRKLTLAEGEKYGLVRETPLDCIWVQQHQEGHNNTCVLGSIEKPVLANTKTGLTAQDITFFNSEKGLIWKIGKGSADKAKKLPQDASLMAVFDGSILTQYAVSAFVQAANAKQEMYFMRSGGSRFHEVVIASLMNPLPMGFISEDERAKREATAVEVLKAIEKHGPDELNLMIVTRLLFDADVVKQNKEAIERLRKTFIEK